MRRSSALWVLAVLAPLVLGLLYAALHPLFAKTPTLLNLVPARAVMTQRFRDRSALDEAWLRPATYQGRASDDLASYRNVAGLPGIDPHRPFHLVLMPRGASPDPTVAVFPVAKEEALRGRFEDPSFFLEHHQIRHAQHLEINGAWAAIGADREAIRHLGEGGITGEDLGEDHLIAADVPALVRFALATADEEPWRSILGALGFDPTQIQVSADGRSVPVGRVQHVHDAWKTARLWSFFATGKLRLDLEVTPGKHADALAHLVRTATGEDETLPHAPPRAEAWIRMPSGAARAALAWLLLGAGVPFPETLGTDADGALGPWGVPSEGGLLVWASPTLGEAGFFTLGLAARKGSLPPLTAFHSRIPSGPGEAEIEAGELSLTRADLTHEGAVPAGRALRRHAKGLDIVVLGGGADDTWARFSTSLAGTLPPPAPPVSPGEGWHLVATFALDQARVRSLFGGQIVAGGLLRALAGGDVRGAIWTNGSVVRLEAAVADRR